MTGSNASGRLMFGAALIFAVLATVVLVFTTSTQWLKLAVIAALWAAFFGAMLSVKYRHQAAARAGEVADLQAVYELELEREVAARREYELEVEAETRRRIAKETEGNNRQDIASLRAELRAIRENLERLTGGEVLVERVALRAQSTRMRAITADPARPPMPQPRPGSGSYQPVPRPPAQMMPAPMTRPPMPAPRPMPMPAPRPMPAPEPAGAHTAGRSVTDLIAAHSPTEDSPRRHRRRTE